MIIALVPFRNEGCSYTPEVYSMKKIYTNEQKEKILKMYWSGEPVTGISASTGVAKSTLYKWIREAPSKKVKPVNMTDFRILKH